MEVNNNMDMYQKRKMRKEKSANEQEKSCASMNINWYPGRVVKLSPEEAKLRDEEKKNKISSPEYLEKSKEENRQRYSNKVRRKGYK